MIFKSDLVDAINSLSHDITTLSFRIREVEHDIMKINNEVDALKFNEKYFKNLEEKTKKNLTSSKKSTNAKKQPRTKDGKFTKKK